MRKDVTLRYEYVRVKPEKDNYAPNAFAAQVIADCEKTEIESAHDTHVERPDVFITEIDQATAL